MRIKIVLDLQGEEPRMLPANYQPELASWIFKTLHFESNSFLDGLRQRGLLNRNNEYNLYTFSNLVVSDFRQQEDRLLINQDQAEIYLSFIDEEKFQPHIIELFEKQEPRIGDKKSKVQFKVKSVEQLKEPVFTDQMKFKAISPLALSDNMKNKEFLAPGKKGYDLVFLKNLMSRYAAMITQMPEPSKNELQGLSNLKFTLLSKPHSKLVKVKNGIPAQENVKGYSFDFSLKAPAELLRFGYYSGFGDHCHLGFGCCEILKP